MKRQLLIALALTGLIAGWCGCVLLQQWLARGVTVWLVAVGVLSLSLGLAARLLGTRATAVLAVVTLVLGSLLADTLPVGDWVLRVPGLSPGPVPVGMRAAVIEVPARFVDPGRFRTPHPLAVQPGWRLTLLARLPQAPADLVRLADGRLLVSLPEADAVVVVPPDLRGEAQLFAGALPGASALAVAGQVLYVMTRDGLKLLPLDDRPLSLQPFAPPVVAGDPARDSLAVTPAGEVFMGVGATAAIPASASPEQGRIVRLDGATAEALARGLRDPAGLWYEARTATLWSTDSARPWPEGTPLPDEINRVVPGADFGWPACVGDRPDPSWGTAAACDHRQSPALLLPPGCRPLDLELLPHPGDGDGRMIVSCAGDAIHGVPPHLLVVPWDDGPRGPAAPVLTALARHGIQGFRPAALLGDGPGRLLVADRVNRALYRLEWGGLRP